MKFVKILLLLVVCTTFSYAAEQSTPQKKNAPSIVLFKTYDKKKDYSGWLMSEKLDGMRAIWTGTQLLSKSGKIINAPDWFIAELPPFGVDGELWTSRENFAKTISIIKKKVSVDAEWKKITYNIFDVLPNSDFVDTGLVSRLDYLKNYLAKRDKKPANSKKVINIIPQILVKDAEHLQQELEKILSLNGEGLILRLPNKPYKSGRNAGALKVKLHREAECKITEHLEGKGKFKGMLGALICETDNGKSIKIGTGFSNAERKDPPAIGKFVTYKYYGFTSKGLPKFPVYLRIREDVDFN